MSCYDCGSISAETRPYGPQGQHVCFTCAFKTEEASRQTHAMFTALLDAAGDVAVATKEGPVPMAGGRH